MFGSNHSTHISAFEDSLVPVSTPASVAAAAAAAAKKKEAAAAKAAAKEKEAREHKEAKEKEAREHKEAKEAKERAKKEKEREKALAKAAKAKHNNDHSIASLVAASNKTYLSTAANVPALSLAENSRVVPVPPVSQSFSSSSSASSSSFSSSSTSFPSSSSSLPSSSSSPVHPPSHSNSSTTSPSPSASSPKSLHSTPPPLHQTLSPFVPSRSQPHNSAHKRATSISSVASHASSASTFSTSLLNYHNSHPNSTSPHHSTNHHHHNNNNNNNNNNNSQTPSLHTSSSSISPTFVYLTNMSDIHLTWRHPERRHESRVFVAGTFNVVESHGPWEQIPMTFNEDKDVFEIHLNVQEKEELSSFLADEELYYQHAHEHSSSSSSSTPQEQHPQQQQQLLPTPPNSASSSTPLSTPHKSPSRRLRFFGRSRHRKEEMEAAAAAAAAAAVTDATHPVTDNSTPSHVASSSASIHSVASVASSNTFVPLRKEYRYQYKFVVDGEWKCDPDQPHIQDNHGNWNHDLIVELVEQFPGTEFSAGAKHSLLPPHDEEATSTAATAVSETIKPKAAAVITNYVPTFEIDETDDVSDGEGGRISRAKQEELEEAAATAAAADVVNDDEGHAVEEQKADDGSSTIDSAAQDMVSFALAQQSEKDHATIAASYADIVNATPLPPPQVFEVKSDKDEVEDEELRKAFALQEALDFAATTVASHKAKFASATATATGPMSISSSLENIRTQNLESSFQVPSPPLTPSFNAHFHRGDGDAAADFGKDYLISPMSVKFEDNLPSLNLFSWEEPASLSDREESETDETENMEEEHAEKDEDAVVENDQVSIKSKEMIETPVLATETKEVAKQPPAQGRVGLFDLFWSIGKCAVVVPAAVTVLAVGLGKEAIKVHRTSGSTKRD